MSARPYNTGVPAASSNREKPATPLSMRGLSIRPEMGPTGAQVDDDGEQRAAHPTEHHRITHVCGTRASTTGSNLACPYAVALGLIVAAQFGWLVFSVFVVAAGLGLGWGRHRRRDGG